MAYLKLLCEQIEELDIVKVYNDPVVFLNEYQTLDFDLCILDINMPGINGLQIANLLTNKYLVFTTAYKEYAVEAYDLDVIDYIVKPIKKERLLQAIAKVKSRFVKENAVKDFFQFNTNKGKTLLFFDQLFYIRTSEVDARDKVASFYDGSTVVLKNVSFNRLLGILPSSQFVRINKKEVVAFKAVQLFSYDEITLNVSSENGKPITLSIGEAYREAFVQKLKS